MAAPSVTRWRLLNSITFGVFAAGLAVPLVEASLQFSSGVSAIEVYATATDGKAEPIKDLTAADFELLEDGVTQKITTFSAGDFPLNAALALDRSFSMAGERLAATKRAAHAFIDALRPDDRVRIVRIGTTFEEADTKAAQHAAIDQIDAWGTTALHDSIIQALDLIESDGPARGRHALVVISDGTDRYSKATEADVLARARRANVIVYPFAIGRRRPELFAELASLTGGRSVLAREAKGLSEAITSVARELRFQYLLGYTPARPLTAGAGEWRSIAVKVKRPGVRVRARDGYLVK